MQFRLTGKQFRLRKNEIKENNENSANNCFGKKWNLNQKYFSKKYYVVFFINIKVYNVSCDG